MEVVWSAVWRWFAGGLERGEEVGGAGEDRGRLRPATPGAVVDENHELRLKLYYRG